jgi:type I restriction enzyme S subunit
MARIAELCELVNGFAFKPSDWATKGLPIVRIQNLNDETAKFNYYSGMTQDKYIINSGELLFSWSGTPGTSFGAFVWSRGRALLNQHIFKVLPKPWVNKHYLMYALNGSIEKIISKAHGGVGLQHITKTELEDIEIVIPDYKSQVKIACTLERIDSLLKLRKQQVSKLDELVKSRFIEMFGNPVTNPKEYKKCKLGEVVKLQGGYAFKSSDYVENGIRLVQIANVNKDNLDWDIINYLPDRYMKMYGMNLFLILIIL